MCLHALRRGPVCTPGLPSLTDVVPMQDAPADAAAAADGAADAAPEAEADAEPADDEADDADLAPTDVVRKYLDGNKPPLGLYDVLAELPVDGGAVGRMKVCTPSLFGCILSVCRTLPVLRYAGVDQNTRNSRTLTCSPHALTHHCGRVVHRGHHVATVPPRPVATHSQQGWDSVVLSCSNSESWPSRLRCRVFVVKKCR